MTITSRRFCQVVLIVIQVTIASRSVSVRADAAAWQPKQTRVFVASLTRFHGDRLHAFTTDDRLDDRFVQVFRDRGVPDSHIVYLKDDAATTQNVASEFTQLLRKSEPGETLIYYFGSHGSYNAKTGEFSFCAFDANVSFSTVLDAIEREFRGKQAILLTDCCHSGGMAELASKRKTDIAYACLSSTYSHQTAWSGWRFVQCLLRGLEGNPVVDLDESGEVDLQELASYTARYMAFAAEGKPIFQVTARFNPKLQLAKTIGTKPPRAGELLEVLSGSNWEKAEILDVREHKLKIHFTKDTRTAHDTWVAPDHVRPFHYERYVVGSVIDVQDSSHGRWYSAKVLDNWESMHLCRYDGWSPAYDEWFGPRRVRKSVAGSWSGRWANDLNQTGAETLELHLEKDEKLTGTWSGDIALAGERIGANTIYFEGTTSGRLYRCVGRIEGTQLLLTYRAHRTDSTGHYDGWAKLGRRDQITDAPRDPRSEFAGKWAGTYENSRGGTGRETLALTERSDKLHGNWSGVDVTGERLGDAVFVLEGSTGDKHYRVIGHVARERLVLDYSATSENGRYTGQSVLAK